MAYEQEQLGARLGIDGWWEGFHWLFLGYIDIWILWYIHVLWSITARTDGFLTTSGPVVPIMDGKQHLKWPAFGPVTSAPRNDAQDDPLAIFFFRIISRLRSGDAGKSGPWEKAWSPKCMFFTQPCQLQTRFWWLDPQVLLFHHIRMWWCGFLFFCAASCLLLLPPSGSLLSSISTLSINWQYLYRFLYPLVFITFVSVNFSLYQFVFLHSSLSTSLSLSINLSLAHSSLSTSLYHLVPYPLLSITFISMNFSLPHSSLSTSLSQLVHCALALPASRLASWALGALATAAVSRGKRAASCFCV